MIASTGRREFLLGALAFFATAPHVAAAVRDTLLLTIYGQSNSIDVGGGRGREKLGAMSLPTDAIMFEGGPETLNTTPDGFQPFTHGDRERASASLLSYAESLGLIGSSRVLIDQPGRSGASFSALGPRSKPYARMLENHMAALALCNAEGSKLRLAPMFLIGGEQDMRLGTSRQQMVGLLDKIVSGVRSSTQMIEGGAARPFFSWQPASHVRLRGDTKSGLDPTETAIGIANAARSIDRFFVTHPAYIHSYFDGVHLDALGHRHNGIMFAKAWSVFAKTGRWQPFEPKAARRSGERSVKVEFQMYAPPLQFDTTRMAPIENHGLSLWSSVGKLKVSKVEIAGPTTVQIETADPLPNNPVLFRTAFDSDATESGKRDLRAGPQLGARTTLCDSDPTTVPMVDGSGRPFDLRNFCLISEVVVN